MKQRQYLLVAAVFTIVLAACGSRNAGDIEPPQLMATLPPAVTIVPPAETAVVARAATDAPTATVAASTTDAAVNTPVPSDTTAANSNANTLPDPDAYQLVQIASGFERPVYLTHAGDGSGRMFVPDQAGRIWVIADGAVRPQPFLDLTDRVTRFSNEQGFLGLAFHPDYASNGFLYVHYSSRNRNGLNTGDTVLSRFTVSPDDPNRADPDSEKTLYTRGQPFPNHNGGELVFGPDGYLYLGLGDGGWAGDPNNAGQDTFNPLGAILRFDVDNGDPYAIPDDNPFVTGGGLAEVWAIGLRNPWRFSFDALTGDLYIGDVGQNIWEEISFQSADAPAGQNFGWRPVEGPECYDGPCNLDDYVPPIATYSHDVGGCSVTGGYVYRGSRDPNMQGVYIYGDYCSGITWTLLQNDDGTWQESDFVWTGLTIASFGVDESGEIYVVDHGGGVYWLTPK